LLRKFIDSPWLYFCLAGLLLVATVLSQFHFGSPAPKPGGAKELRALPDRGDLNVVFILIDTLRADRLHCYGYSRETSPNLDELAARGVRFAHVESQSSWTKSSMASIWTGLYPQQTGVLGFAHALPDEALLPAEIFGKAGYRTAGVWRNGWVANNFGFGQGFDLYFRPTPSRPARNEKRNAARRVLQGTDMDATLSASEFIRANSARRFFLYVHYMDVHQYLYADTSPSWGSAFSDIYDSAIHWTDRNVGVLLETLLDAGVLDRTLVVVAADHGEAFFEHGAEGHARNLYAEVTQVPLIIMPPMDLRPGLVVEERVANIDIWPTILDAVGLPPLPHSDGRSLMPLVLAAAEGGSAPDDLASRIFFAQLDQNWGRQKKEPNPLVAVTDGDHRLIESIGAPDRAELYDRSQDPGEKHDIAAENAELTDQLRDRVASYFEQPRANWKEAPEIEIDEMQRNQLRALGYMVPGGKQRRAKPARKQVPTPKPAKAEGKGQ